MLAGGPLLAEAPIVTMQAPEGAVIHHVRREQGGRGPAPAQAAKHGHEGAPV